MTQNKDLDLLLIHPGGRKTVYQSLGADLSGIQPPLWAAMIATFIRKRGYSVAILDSEAEDLSAEETAERAGDINPMLAAVVVYGNQPSASTQNMPAAGAICTAIRQHSPDISTLLVGGHVASLPERTLLEEDADFVAGGEGPYTVLELLEALKSGRSDYSKVRGLWYQEGGQTKSNPPAPLVSDLSAEMPGMAWDLLPMDKYRAHNWHAFGDLQRQPYAALYTTLGCPYHCTFCCIQAPFKSSEAALGLKANVNSYRFWSPETVVAQIDTLVNQYGVRNLRIADEMFVLNKRHIEGICDLIIEHGYDLNIWAYARVDSIPGQDTLDKLKRAGFNWLCLGIESASERVLTNVDKGYERQQLSQTMDQIGEAGISVLANFIFGLPEDDRDSMQETLDLATDLNCEFANFYSAMAYPGSPLYNLAIKQGWQLPEKWSGYSQHSVDSLPLPTKYLSGSEVLGFRDQAWQAYFTSPKYLAMIDKKFGPATVQHINEMASHHLVRANA